MAINTYRLPGKQKSKGGFFAAIERFLRIDESLTEVIHVRFLPQILFLSFLCVIYIGNRHHAEKKIRNISILERQVDDLRADYTTLKADFMFESKQSEVAKRAAKLGLAESIHPPEKITIRE
jgi:hypothetical protein